MIGAQSNSVLTVTCIHSKATLIGTPVLLFIHAIIQLGQELQIMFTSDIRHKNVISGALTVAWLLLISWDFHTRR